MGLMMCEGKFVSRDEIALLQTVTLIPAESPTAKLLSWLFLSPIQRLQSVLLVLLIRITPNIF